MAKLEDLTRGAAVKGILPDCLVTVIDVNLADHTLLQVLANGELIIASGSGNGYRLAEIVDGRPDGPVASR